MHSVADLDASGADAPMQPAAADDSAALPIEHAVHVVLVCVEARSEEAQLRHDVVERLWAFRCPEDEGREMLATLVLSLLHGGRVVG